ncbi:DUF222 domain-containing protein [Microbacterium sp. BG28]|uniref:HNH endonuclease signature motif containing protein n=1 Tax=Microbacterium sp. BG28 TaxID=3097356 RepID=UPI002A5AFA7F|nr:DUF222 domain-containing protein [Microbacterium sp. BG28]MDY0828783.1 DUF222 domain-containing protein [Microbacterium sp. BG28]
MDEDDTFDDDRRIARSWEAPPSGFDEPDLIDQVVGMASLVSSFAAQRAVAIAEARAAALVESASRGGDRGIAERSFRLEISQALRVTESTAERLVSQAVALTERYDGVLDALGRGAITEQHARILVDAVDAAELPLRGELATLALELAERMPVGQFRAAVRALVEGARAVSLEQRHDDAVRMRRVSVEADSNGMAWLSAYLPAVEARAIFQRLTAMGSALLTAEREAAAAGDLAETSVGDEIDGSLAPRTLDQVRADLLGDLLVDAEVTEHPEAVRGVRATVAVTVPVLSLLDDDAAAIAPAELDGVGPIPIRTARTLCGAADGWMRVLTHPETGVVLSVGRTRYRPPADLQRLVRWRAARCTAPGCRIAADRCEIDHTVAWEHGGETRADNLTPLCKGHHTVKHHRGWQTRQHPDGVIIWTSPAGRCYRVEPERRTPRFAPASAGRAYGAPEGEAPPF